MKPRRFTVRRLMIVVALVAFAMSISSWAKQRWYEAQAYYEARLGYHRFHASMYRIFLQPPSSQWILQPFPPPTAAEIDQTVRRIDYHEALIPKYERAVRHPWLPVAADPPEPD